MVSGKAGAFGRSDAGLRSWHNSPMLKWIDIPPVWLTGCVFLAWMQARMIALGLSFHGVWVDFLAGLIIGAGLLLMALALAEFRRNRTTPIPHMQAAHLIRGGIFGLTRNPIYLGDVLILSGLILYWDAVLSLPLVPVFIRVLHSRFILPEESRLKAQFGDEFLSYCKMTRRWF